MKIVPIFPKTIAVSNLGREFTETELNFVKNEYENNSSKNILNLIGNDRQVLDKPELSDIRNFINDQLQVYVKNLLCIDDSVEFYITISWLNFTRKGESHHNHNHPNSFLSGVFYFNADANKDNITFSDNTYHQIEFKPTKYNDFNCSTWTMPVNSGDLLLFNSSIPHSVSKTEEEHLRTSLSFNTFIKGEIGSGVSYLKI